MNKHNLPHQPDADKDRLPCLICGASATVDKPRVSEDAAGRRRLLNAPECLCAFCPKCERYHPGKIRKIKKAVAVRFFDGFERMRKERVAK